MLATIAIIGAWLASLATIYALFHSLDAKLRSESRLALCSWLQGEPGFENSLLRQFPHLFDRFFLIEKPLTSRLPFIFLPSPIRSILATGLALLIVVFVWMQFLPADVDFSIESVLPGYRPNFFVQYDFLVKIDGVLVSIVALEVIFVPFILNCITDYVSLIETRAILHWISRLTSKLAIVFLLVGDLFVTFLLSFVGYIVFFGIALWLNTSDISYFDAVESRIVWFLPQFNFADVPFQKIEGIPIYSTFLTSVWLYVYVCSAFLLVSLRVIPAVSKLINRFFDYDQEIAAHPLTMMGTAIMVILTAVFLLTEAL